MLGRKRATLAGGSRGTYLIVAIILTSGGRLDPARAEGVIKPPGHFSPFVETILVLRKGGYAAHLSLSLFVATLTV